MTTLAQLETAIVQAAVAVLRRRSAALVDLARKSITTVEKDGREVVILGAEASVMLGTAALLRDCADDVAAMTLLPSTLPGTVAR